MTMNKVFLAVALGVVVSCGGSPPPAAAPEPAAAEPPLETFGPGLASHDGAADAVERDAARVLGKLYRLASGDEPGVVTTEWVEDPSIWPGAQTRVRAVITSDRVIVRIECRAERECARTVPDKLQLAALPQQLADKIVAGRLAEQLLSKMRDFTASVCACNDMACAEHVEKQMMEWAMRNMDAFKNVKPTKAQEEEADRIEERMDACKARFEPPAPAPPPPPRSYGSSGGAGARKYGTTGSPECDEYLKTFDRVVLKCQKELGPALDAMRQSRDAQAEAFAQWDTLDEVSRKATIDAAATGCKSATEALQVSAQSMGCKL